MERAFLVTSTLCFLAGFAYAMYALGAKVRRPSRWNFVAVSYTHLTLPTIYSV